MADRIRYWVSFLEGGAGWTRWREASRREYDRVKDRRDYRTKTTGADHA